MAETDIDAIHEVLAEIRTHMTAMVATIDRLLWFMTEHEPPFDQDGDAQE